LIRGDLRSFFYLPLTTARERLGALTPVFFYVIRSLAKGKPSPASPEVEETPIHVQPRFFPAKNRPALEPVVLR
jgi:hypothetical protein